MKGRLVSEIMSTDLVTVSPFDTLMTVSKIFENNNIHHLPVLKDNKLVGIISNSDFERCKQGKSLFVNATVDEQNEILLTVTLVSMVMTENVETISAQEPLFSAYKTFKEKPFRSLPVIDNDVLVGIITPMDFLDFYFQQNQ